MNMNNKEIMMIATLALSTQLCAMEKTLDAFGYESLEINDLDTFDYKAASVLPRFKTENGDMVVIGREGSERSKSRGLYADWGGFKSRTLPENPTVTAARELWEESAGNLGDLNTRQKLEDYINIAEKNTESVVANVQLKHAVFITRFEQQIIEKFGSSFFKLQQSITEKEKERKEKDEIAFVKWQELYEKIKNCQIDARGFASDVKLKAALVYDVQGKRTDVDIIVRAGLVAVLYPFFNDSQKDNAKKMFLYKSRLIKS
jgi:hypothetical protein